MDKIEQINRWFKSRNDLEKIILLLGAMALGVGSAIAHREYWNFQYNQCKKLPEYEAIDCSMNLTKQRFGL